MSKKSSTSISKVFGFVIWDLDVLRTEINNGFVQA